MRADARGRGRIPEIRILSGVNGRNLKEAGILVVGVVPPALLVDAAAVVILFEILLLVVLFFEIF